jgi:hypothetical protein
VTFIVVLGWSFWNIAGAFVAYISIQHTEPWITNKKLYWGSVTYFASEMKYATYNSVSRIQH